MTERTCRTCTHWSPYTPGLGECLVYAKAREAARATAANFAQDWPLIPPPDKADDETCSQHEVTP